MLPPDDIMIIGDALSGIMPVPHDDEDYECINATYDGPCKSGERVTRANAPCSKCIVSDFSVRHAIALIALLDVSVLDS